MTETVKDLAAVGMLIGFLVMLSGGFRKFFDNLFGLIVLVGVVGGFLWVGSQDNVLGTQIQGPQAVLGLMFAGMAIGIVFLVKGGRS